jgi:hypothetical protein
LSLLNYSTLLLLAGRSFALGVNMRLFSIYSALAAAGWLSLDVLFVIAWARLHAAQRHLQQTKATIIEFRPIPNDLVLARSNAHRLASRRPQITYSH